MEKVVQAKPLNRDETSLVNTCALLSSFMYLDTQDISYTGRTLKDLVFDDDFMSKANQKYLSAIQDAILKNPSVGDIAILSQSAADNLNVPEGDPYSGFGPELVIANAFVLNNGDVCVAYRGTGEGKWIDNGQGFGQESTVMQEAAARYFDYVIEEYGAYNNERFYVTGHSKGGNKAQYVCMASEHRDDISHCYEFDGQGFSPEAIEKFKEINGGTWFYDKQVDKITGVCGKNDFVSPLGISIVRPDQTYYVNTVNSALNLAGYHDIVYMLNQESPDRLNFKYNSHGDAISVEQGNLGKCASSLSDRVMKMEVDERRDCGIAMMSIIELITQLKRGTGFGRGTGDVKSPSVENGVTLLIKGFPILGDALVDKSTFDSVYGLCHNLIKEGTKDNKFGKIIGALGIGTIYTASYVVGLPLFKAIGGVSYLTAAAIHGVKEIGVKIKERIGIVKETEADSLYFLNNIMQERYENIGKSYGYDIKHNFRNDWNVRMSSLETGIPELAVVVAASSVEQYLYQRNRMEKGPHTHTVINYIDIASELGMKYGNGQVTQDIQKKALYTAEHRAIECLKRGENVMLFLPDMYEPTFRAQVNADISKALKNMKYTSTAIVLDNTNEHMFKYTNRNFATYMEQQISNIAKDLLERYPPSTDDINCKYDFVVSDGLNKGHTYTALDSTEVMTMIEYMDALDDAYREVFGTYSIDDYDINEYYEIFEMKMQEQLAGSVDSFYSKLDFEELSNSMNEFYNKEDVDYFER